MSETMSKPKTAPEARLETQAGIIAVNLKTTVSARQQEEAAARKRQREHEETAARERARQQKEQESRRNSSQGKLSEPEALEILGLNAGATNEEIRAAYNGLMKRVHPDIGGANFFAKQLNEARETLCGAL